MRLLEVFGGIQELYYLRREVVMPYKSNSELPAAARKRLSSHQQTVFREAFNNALKEYHGNESKAFAVAWVAAKKA